MFEAATPKADRLEAEEDHIDISRRFPGGANAAAGKTGIAGGQRAPSAASAASAAGQSAARVPSAANASAPSAANA